MRHGLGIAWLLVFVGLAANGFSSTTADAPQGTLQELVLASDIKTVENHLPTALTDRMRKLDPTARQRFEQALLISKTLKQAGAEVAVPDDGHALLVLKRGDDATDVKVTREISNGGEALLVLDLIRSGQSNGTIMVWLRMEDGAWRVTELQQPGFRGDDIVLDDPAFMERFQSPEQAQSDSNVVSMLWTLNYQLISYRQANPDIGFPSNLADLNTAQKLGAITSDDGEEDDSAESADKSPSTNDFVQGGYAFHYVAGGGEHGGYSITARPTEYGKTGTRSFYVDESAVVRSTIENREANASDPPLNPRGVYAGAHID